MGWHDLVFSDELRLRSRRHVIFWIGWLLYFAFTFFYRQQPYNDEGGWAWTVLVLVKSLFILTGHALVCYVTMYFLLPRYLLREKYFRFSGWLLATGIIVTIWTYFCYDWIFPSLDRALHAKAVLFGNVLLWNSLFTGFLSALKLVAVAVTIKLLKGWWRKQQENMLLEREKIDVELQLLKAQIHPDFLFSSLDKIYYFAQNDSLKASSLLLKLSDLLSYMLYECSQPSVPLDRELKMIGDYLELEKKRLEDQLDLNVQIIGNPAGKKIAPLLLLPFIENSMLFCEDRMAEKYWLNVDVRVADEALTMKLINGKAADDTVTTAMIAKGLANVQKRLDILYKYAYELKITVEPDYMITLLKIGKSEPEKVDASVLSPVERSNEQTHVYASL